MQTDAGLIGRIYDCAMAPHGFPEVLQEIADRAGAFGAMLFDSHQTAQGERVALNVCSSAYDPTIVQGYVARFNADEVRDQERFARLSSTGNDINLIPCEALRDTRHELEQQANVRAMMEMGIHFRAGALLSKETRATDRFSLQMRRRHGPITPEANAWVSGLLPHLAKSLSIGRNFSNLSLGQRLLQAALDALPFGIALANSRGDLTFANTEFSRIDDHHGLCDRRRARLALDMLPAQIRALMVGRQEHGRHGARPRHEAVFLHRDDPPADLFVEVAPIADHPEFGHLGDDMFLISVLDTGRAHDIRPDVLGRYFSISTSEVAVLEMIVKGRTNPEIAESRGRALETVNSQVKALIRKMGVRNRTELVRLSVSLSASGLVDLRAHGHALGAEGAQRV